MIFELGKYAGVLLTPPGVIVLIALLGLLLQIRWRWIGFTVTAASIFALLLLSSPLVGQRLLAGLERKHPALPPGLSGTALRERAQAIVVLGAGRYTRPPEYESDTVSGMALERLRYAATLHRASGLPLLVSGGSPFAEPVAEAELMATVLKTDLGISTRWVESKSRNTFENARFAADMLQAEGIRRVLIVTHAAHMPRSRWAFEQVGLVVVPAPTGFTTISSFERGVFGYLPAAYGLRRSSTALHERIGLFWYQWRYKPTTAGPEAAISVK
jgi:uncharacterized SAM-binding protein YcdF (DUF218 family)